MYLYSIVYTYSCIVIGTEVLVPLPRMLVTAYMLSDVWARQKISYIASLPAGLLNMNINVIHGCVRIKIPLDIIILARINFLSFSPSWPKLPIHPQICKSR
uniref:Uncharacterized protein n=1 Tax=Cacopsylla melanoneura TaxID=428564 RepID=A0A8D9F694_9HEMI